MNTISRPLCDFCRQSDFFRPWRNQIGEFRAYFAVYRSGRGIFSSPYLHLSIILGIAIRLIGVPQNGYGQIIIGILPNLLGFTIGGMAIVLSVAGHKIFRTLAEEGQPDSFFIKLIASVLHYVVTQVVTLSLGVMFFEKQQIIIDLILITSLSYCLLLASSIGIQLFQMAKIYNSYASLPKDKTPPDI